MFTTGIVYSDSIRQTALLACILSSCIPCRQPAVYPHNSTSLPAAAKFAARCTKRIITVTIKYVMYANKSLILTLTLNPI